MKKKPTEVSFFGVSFLDVLGNTIGGLAFLLVLAVLMIGFLVFTPPLIVTEALPDAYHGHEYEAWLSAREGLGKFAWSFGDGEPPPGLALDAESGRLWGRPELTAEDGDRKDFEFSVLCESTAEEVGEAEVRGERRLALAVHRDRPVNTVPLRLTTPPELPAAYLEKPFPFAFAAEGGQAPYRWRAPRGGLPPGLRLERGGVLAGRPTATGVYQFEVAVETAAGESAAETFSLAVAELHPPPPPPPPLTLLTDSLPAAVAERPYRVWPAALGGTPPYDWRIVVGRPAWLGRSEAGPAFDGRPALDHVGESRLVLRLTDAAGASVESAPIDFEVLPRSMELPPPLAIRTRVLPDARADAAYELAVAADGGFPPYTWSSAVSSQAEGGLRLSAEGILRGTPTRIGAVPIALSVTDAVGRTAEAAVRLEVNPPLLPVKVSTTRLPPARVGREYVFELAATGGHPGYRWQVEGAVPPGLKLDAATGRISGNPTEPGTWPLGFSAFDARDRRSEDVLEVDFPVLTERGTRPLTVTTRALPEVRLGKAVDLTPACEGGLEPYTWTLGGAPPPGLRLEDGRLSGRPSEPGVFEVTFEVTDAAGQTAAATLPLAVRWLVPFWTLALVALLAALAVVAIFLIMRRSRPLEITTRSIPNARASCDYEVQLACSGGTPPYRWRLTDGELPPGLLLEDGGRIVGCPFKDVGVDKTKDVPFEVSVVDRYGRRDIRRL